MYELWMLIYIVFFPAAWLGWIGLLGETAKRAADKYFDILGYVFVIIGILLILDFFLPVAIAIVQSIVASIFGG